MGYTVMPFTTISQSEDGGPEHKSIGDCMNQCNDDAKCVGFMTMRGMMPGGNTRCWLTRGNNPLVGTGGASYGPDFYQKE